MQKIMIVFLFLLMIGCASKETVYVASKGTIVHHPLPSPIQPYKFNWKVVPTEKQVIVGLEYNESLEFRLFMEDMKRYIKESNDLICSYRVELKEERCTDKDSLSKDKN